MSEKTFLNFFKLVGIKGIQNVGTPHDWEDYEKYKKELDKHETD